MMPSPSWYDRFRGRGPVSGEGEKRECEICQDLRYSLQIWKYFQINKTFPWNQGQPLKWELFCGSIPKPGEMISNASTELCSEMPLLFGMWKAESESSPSGHHAWGCVTKLHTSNEERVSGTMGSNCYFYLEKWIATFSALTTFFQKFTKDNNFEWPAWEMILNLFQ